MKQIITVKSFLIFNNGKASQGLTDVIKMVEEVLKSEENNIKFLGVKSNYDHEYLAHFDIYLEGSGNEISRIASVIDGYTHTISRFDSMVVYEVTNIKTTSTIPEDLEKGKKEDDSKGDDLPFGSPVGLADNWHLIAVVLVILIILVID
ncbi:MAG: hypothetical protein ACOCP8_06040 [archaeon]